MVPYSFDTNKREAYRREVKKPKVKVNFENFDFYCMMLSKAGYGSIDILRGYDIETFINLIHYENFVADYRDEMLALNKE